MKRILVLLTALAAFNADALPIGGVPAAVPIEVERNYEVTLGSGGYAVSYSEDYYQNGPIGQLARQLVTVPLQIENTLNDVVAASAADEMHAIFMGGSLEGNPMVQISPKNDGTALISLSGVSYNATVKKKVELFGVTVLSCKARLQMDGVSIVAQYGSVDGQIHDDSVGFNGQPSIDTNCNSFLTWLKPVIGIYLTNRLESAADHALLNGVKSAMNTIKDKLLLSPDQNFLRGLNALIPQDKTIALPDGSVLPIGQYVHDNVAYLASKSTFTMQISRGLAGVHKRVGYDEVIEDSGDVLYLSLDSPVISFDLLLTEKSKTFWEATCGNPAYENPMVCP